MHICALHNAHAKQRGAVLMIMMLILILGAASFMLTKLGKGDARQPVAVDTTAELGAVRDALIGFAITNNGCLPCPSATATSGAAPNSCATAATRVGFLPWLTLNLGRQDRWSHRYRYKVDPNYATGSGCTFLTSADMSAQTRDGLGTLQNIPLPSTLAAVIVSHGPNGFGAFNADAIGTALANPPAANLDETTNRNNATLVFIQRPMVTDPFNPAVPIPAIASGGPFDDVVAWVTRQELHDQVDASDCCDPLPP